ncbi:hypothetical protein [Streptomyces qinzhouensis]|uniref:hypothetical protein n=1 Tax=Streptomyces qinzhouensis TaxID=2599401 RepID=UPI001FE4ED9B|nr:hypothetical protein [Streptomyces qinzhouensis]
MVTTALRTYDCWAAARTRDSIEPISLGTRTASSPRLALRWLRNRTAAITAQLDPPYARPGRDWLTSEAEQEEALALLATGHTYRVTLHDDQTTYVIAATPPRTAAW